VQIDEKVGVMDGQNHMTLVNVTKIEKTRAWGVKISSETLQVELPIQIDLAQAIGKKDKFEEVVDKATQLGVSNIIPLLTQHTLVKASDWSAKVARWQKIALEAAQQSGRGIIPQCLQPQQIMQLKKDPYDAIYLLNQNGQSPEVFKEKKSKILILVGPEGDFNEAEMQHIQSIGGQRIALGPRIYRTEVAGLVALSMLNFLYL
jgi:16S rRNA (uracil1498-N3)-methyltransferase